jgi:type IV pilus assembly protein PilB
MVLEVQDPVITVLREEGYLDEKTLQKVLEEHAHAGLSVLSILKRDSLLGEDQLVRLVAASNKIEFINLSPDDIDPMVAHLVSYEMANRYTLIPVQRQDDKLIVAMSCPMNLVVRDQIEMKSGYTIVPVAAMPSAIRQAVNVHFDMTNVTKQAIASMRLKEDKDSDFEEEGGKDLSERVAQDPVTKLVSSVIRGAIDARASDIHIEPQENDVRVRYRVDGMLRSAVSVPLSAQNEVVSHIKIMANMDISEKRIPQDGHMALRHSNKEYDLRISSLPAMGGEKIVIRILDKNVDRWNINDVVTSDFDIKQFKELLANPYGMILLTGPTGSGKTTTLYSLLQVLNTPERNIVTVEDPVEYRLDGITQVQVRPAAGLTFASSLRSIVRQDPDIILIGEIRDLETAEIAVSAALTGHLVLSTLHTNDAAGAISRLINLGVAPFLVGSALLGTVAQRLVRTNCPKCKRLYNPHTYERRVLFGVEGPPEKVQLTRSTGCNHCYQTGYKGRKSIYEILMVGPEIRRMVLAGQPDDTIKQKAIKEGMRTLQNSAKHEVLLGNTTVEEISRVVDMSYFSWLNFGTLH